MLDTEDFSMRHYVGFSQIGSHMCVAQNKHLKLVGHLLYMVTLL